VTNITATRPDASEYAPYYEKYISLVPAGDVIKILSGQLDETLALLRGLSEAQGDSRYAPDKWSIKEVVGHVLDTERIFGHRAFRFARNDETPLPGFEQDDYVRAADFGRRTLVDLADEFAHVRRANLSLLRSLDEEAWRRRGAANNNAVSVRALAYIMAGHIVHHVH
jgi:DinB superfamily